MVEWDRDRLVAHGVDLGRAQASLQTDNFQLSGGRFVEDGRVVRVRSLATLSDVDAIRRMKFQMLLGGVTAGHGELAVQSVNAPVSVGGMDVAPGELIHMDENGAVKFPAQHAPAVLKNAQAMLADEAEKLEKMRKAKTAAEIRAINSGGTYGAKKG